ncbi:gag protein [Colletotrichum asianum]
MDEPLSSLNLSKKSSSIFRDLRTPYNPSSKTWTRDAKLNLLRLITNFLNDVKKRANNNKRLTPDTRCYDNNYQIHLSDKENSGYYPPKPKTLAMMHASNSKIARKPAEPLNKMLQIQQLELITSHITPQQSRHEEQQIQREMKIIQQEDAR